VAPEASVEWLGIGEHVLECIAAAGADDVIGILSCRKLHEAERAVGAKQGQGARSGADRGLLAGIVTIES
jgi:hypothetical protein